MTTTLGQVPGNGGKRRVGFWEDFRRFFVRGLATLLPTLITIWLVVWVWSFLWENLGRHMMVMVQYLHYYLGEAGLIPAEPWGQIRRIWRGTDDEYIWQAQVIGVGLAIILVYIVGLLVGNLIGRTVWRILEAAVFKIPLVRAIYPAVKQVTDFLLADRSHQFAGARVVAVQPHAQEIWSIALVTGDGLKPLSDAVGDEMVTVFVPSSPTAFSGYVMVVPRKTVVELPLTVEEAMRLLVSGGVIAPTGKAQDEPGEAASAERKTLPPGAGPAMQVSA